MKVKVNTIGRREWKKVQKNWEGRGREFVFYLLFSSMYTPFFTFLRHEAIRRKCLFVSEIFKSWGSKGLTFCIHFLSKLKMCIFYFNTFIWKLQTSASFTLYRQCAPNVCLSLGRISERRNNLYFSQFSISCSRL